jgi:Peptidase family S41
LRRDFTVFRGALEESHPSLYWFTPKNKVDQLFDEGYENLGDSMTERQFRTGLLKIVSGIRCGHTSVSYSKKYSRYLDTADLKLFPLLFKVLEDTLVITRNLNEKDDALTRGTVVTAINNRTATQLIDTFITYTTGDGYSKTGRYQSLSSWGNFGVLYKNIFGLTDSFKVSYISEEGSVKQKTIPVYQPVKDSPDATDSLKPEKYSAKERRTLRSLSVRSLQVDTLLKSGFMSLNTFARGNGLKKFFKRSFGTIDQYKLKYLVLDLRSNGGGDASNSTLLTQYLIDHKFKIADSLYGIKRTTRYRDYIPLQPVYWLMMRTVTRKHSDGKYHFGYFERHLFHPKSRHHFNGQIYLLTGGNSFSATTLLVQDLKGQKNVTVVGEETGGGGYGNTAWIIPELTLPNTRLRIGIPKLRLVMRKNLVKEGRGVMPDILVVPTPADIKYGKDVKVEKVRALIMGPADQ